MFGARMAWFNFETDGNTIGPARPVVAPAAGTFGRCHPGRGADTRPVAPQPAPRNGIATLVLPTGRQFPNGLRSKSIRAGAERKTAARPDRGQSRTNAPSRRTPAPDGRETFQGRRCGASVAARVSQKFAPPKSAGPFLAGGWRGWLRDWRERFRIVDRVQRSRPGVHARWS